MAFKNKEILNRKEFSYDMEQDPLYQQYKKQYTQQGQQAMADTMGKSAALTGGYGSTYTQSAGQQAYQDYMQQLSSVAPELYRLAMDRYQMEEDSLYRQAEYLDGREQTAYDRWADARDFGYQQYRDSVGDSRWQQEFDYDKSVSDRDFAYQKAQDDRDFGYQQYRDSVSNSQWQQTFNFQKETDHRDFLENKSRYDREHPQTQTQTSTQTGSTGSGYDTHGYTKEQIKSLQRAAGIRADGIWGPVTEKAYQAGYRP